MDGRSHDIMDTHTPVGCNRKRMFTRTTVRPEMLEAFLSLKSAWDCGGGDELSLAESPLTARLSIGSLATPFTHHTSRALRGLCFSSFRFGRLCYTLDFPS